MIPVSRWHIGRVRSVPPTPGSDCDTAYALHFREDDQPEPQITVEYVSGGGGKYASPAHARKVAEPYLNDEIPQRRLIVDRDGNARRHDS